MLIRQDFFFSLQLLVRNQNNRMKIQLNIRVSDNQAKTDPNLFFLFEKVKKHRLNQLFYLRI